MSTADGAFARDFTAPSTENPEFICRIVAVFAPLRPPSRRPIRGVDTRLEWHYETGQTDLEGGPEGWTVK